MSDLLDDAAVAALWGLTPNQEEHLGLLYEENGHIEWTPAQSQDKRNASRGSFSVPAGSLRAVFHNHPLPENPRVRLGAQRFSPDDMAQANKLRVPSYIAVGNEVRRYTPGAFSNRGEPVLAQIPLKPIQEKYRRPTNLDDLIAPGKP